MAKLTKVVLKNEIKPGTEQSDFAAAETCPNTCRGAAQFLLCRNTTSRFEELRGLNLYKPCRRIKAGELCSPLPPFVGLSQD